MLAAQARLLFDEARQDRMRRSARSGEGAKAELIISSESRIKLINEIRSNLKSYLRQVNRQQSALSPEETAGNEVLRDLVSLHRELAKQAADGAFDELIGKTTKITSAVTMEAAPCPVATSPPQSRGFQRPPLAGASTQQKAKPEKAGQSVPAFRMDRRKVQRQRSNKPLFSVVAAEYLALRETARGKGDKDIKIARARLDLFIDLIGDHPVDTYNGTDLQAFVELMQYWPGARKERDPTASALSVIEDNRDLHLRPLALKTLKEGYVSVVRSAIRSRLTEYDYQDPFGGVGIRYPATAASPVSAEPLSAYRISEIFRIGIKSGVMHYAMLPLLGHLTGRRLSLLVHLTGNDFREKFENVWVAQSSGIMKINGRWKRVPIKTDASLTFFVLHRLLSEIGFIDWAVRQKDGYIFPALMRLKDPNKSASSYMQRLFARAGVAGGRKEVFHSLRGGNIEDMRDAKVDPRDRKLQAGHQIGADEHELYGFRSVSERRAREIAKMPLNPDIDYTMFRGLDFDRLAKADGGQGRVRRGTLSAPPYERRPG